MLFPKTSSFQPKFMLKKTNSQTARRPLKVDSSLNQQTISFLEKNKNLKKTKTENKQNPRNTMSKIVAGRELGENGVEKMKEHENNQNAPKQNN